MRKVSIGLFFAMFMVIGLAGNAGAGMDLGISIGEIGEKGIDSFFLSVGEYYKVPQKEIIVVKERHIPDEEIPVVMFIVRNAGISPAKIVDLRLGGKSWMDISLQFGISPEKFYVPVKEVQGPPYGKAYGHYKKKKSKKEWKSNELTDEDVVNLINLKFISEHYGCSSDEVIRMRSQGKGFVAINDEVRNVKKDKGKSKDKDFEKEERKGRGKGHKAEKHKGKGKEDN